MARVPQGVLLAASLASLGLGLVLLAWAVWGLGEWLL